MTRYSFGWILSLRFAPFRMTKAKASLYRILHTVLVIPSEAKESSVNESGRTQTNRFTTHDSLLIRLDSFTSLRSVQNDGAFKFNFFNTT